MELTNKARSEIAYTYPDANQESSGRRDLRSLLARAWATNRPLTFLGVAMSLALVASLAGLALDPRSIAGAPAWLKPMKFAISIGVYSFTLLWLLSLVQGRPRLVRVATLGTTAAGLVEMVIIMLQAARGTMSHFNVATPLDGALFNIMGMFVILLWLMNLLAALLLLFQRLPDPAFAWALRLGLLLTLTGGSTGFLMTLPTPTQMAAMQADRPVSLVGAHSVGVQDGGPGLPLTGWSTTGGDLRVGHFVGLHALQVMPLVGWLLTRRRTRKLGDGHRVALAWTAGLAYLGLIALLTWQALRGQPLIAPDAATLAAAGALFGAAILAVAAIVGHARRVARLALPSPV